MLNLYTEILNPPWRKYSKPLIWQKSFLFIEQVKNMNREKKFSSKFSFV